MSTSTYFHNKYGKNYTVQHIETFQLDNKLTNVLKAFFSQSPFFTTRYRNKFIAFNQYNLFFVNFVILEEEKLDAVNIVKSLSTIISNVIRKIIIDSQILLEETIFFSLGSMFTFHITWIPIHHDILCISEKA